MKTLTKCNQSGINEQDRSHAKKSQRPIFHYTNKIALNSIMREGVIRLAVESAVGKERPVVWLSDDPFWEETANKMVMDSNGNAHFGDRNTTQRVAGLARIEVERDPTIQRWNHFKRNGWFSDARKRGLEQAALQMKANPYQWFVSTETILKSKWKSIQIFNGSVWEELEDWKTRIGQESADCFGLLGFSEPGAKFHDNVQIGELGHIKFTLPEETRKVLKDKGVSIEEFTRILADNPDAFGQMVDRRGFRGP